MVREAACVLTMRSQVLLEFKQSPQVPVHRETPKGDNAGQASPANMRCLLFGANLQNYRAEGDLGYILHQRQVSTTAGCE